MPPSAQPQQRCSLRGGRGRCSADSATKPPAGKREQERERKQQLSTGTAQGPKRRARGTHRVAEQIHSEVRVIDPREAQALWSRGHAAGPELSPSQPHEFQEEEDGSPFIDREP